MELPGNDALVWQADTFGYSPRFDADSEAWAESFSSDDVGALIEALHDETRFVAAHVLLTRLSGVKYSVFPSWNGLALDISADGVVHIDSDQRSELVDRWRRWYQGDPRPPELPE